jgi:hypothetical protein
MSQERLSHPAPKRPYEIYGLTEHERQYWRLSTERFEEVLEDERNIVHTIKDSSNNYGEFLFVTTSRPGEHGRICMTFYGLGYHEHRERWLHEEWFWYQASANPDLLNQRIEKEKAKKILEQRLADIGHHLGEVTQSERGRLFELLADLTDEDGALAEMEDLENISRFLFDDPENQLPPNPPIGDNLLDDESKAKLPELYSGEEKGLDALAQVKFFTPDSNWTWYVSEFDGEDIMFGLVSGFELELGYFSLKELKEARGPWGLPIERDLHYDPQTLRDLMKKHQSEGK